MRIGVPKEIKNHEYRVGLIPAVVHALGAHGHQVVVEQGAGLGSGIQDGEYVAAGATMLASADEVWKTAEMVVKVKEPQPAEWARLRDGQILFTYLHLAADPEQTRGLIASRCTAAWSRSIAALLPSSPAPAMASRRWRCGWRGAGNR